MQELYKALFVISLIVGRLTLNLDIFIDINSSTVSPDLLSMIK
jgi:hypothetical protein